MKIFKLSILAALISSPLAAEETIDKTWQLGVFGDYVKSSTNKENKLDWQRIEAGKSIGIDLQKIINDSWDIRLELARTRYDINNGNDKKYGNRYGIDAIYKLDDSDLYVFTGVKRFNNVKSYNAVNVGAGYNFQLSERAAFYTEAAVYRDVNYGYTDQSIKLGFKYTFGEEQTSPVIRKTEKMVKQSPVEKAPVKKMVNLDDDTDGINNDNDRCANTPATVKVDSKGCTLYSEQSVSIDLNVAFANNSSQLKPSTITDIQRLADFMKEYTNTNVVIEGHSSATGSADYNLMLSQKRANSVKDVLVNKFNIDASRLSAKGFGPSQLLSTGNTAADHQLNRRVVAKIETTIEKVVTK